jgi:hypothetical protein
VDSKLKYNGEEEQIKQEARNNLNNSDLNEKDYSDL